MAELISKCPHCKSDLQMQYEHAVAFTDDSEVLNWD